MADRDVHLPNLARELHSTRQLTPIMQIRNRTGFRQPVDDYRALHAKVAHLEAQLHRLSFDARRTPSPGCSPRASPRRSGRSSPASPLLEERDNNKEMIQLKQMNTQLMAQLVTAVLGAMDRRDPAPPVSPAAAAKPFRDWLPQVEAYVGEAQRAPEAFLAQFYPNARQNNVPASERARQLIGKLTGPAQTWYTVTFAADPSAATESQIGSSQGVWAGVRWGTGPPRHVSLRHSRRIVELSGCWHSTNARISACSGSRGMPARSRPALVGCWPCSFRSSSTPRAYGRLSLL
jgi:hypothetical protein